MLDAKQQPWLIDFDKCHVKKGNQWKQENLSRLRRSFIKEIHITPNFYFSLADFVLILSGYHA